MFVSNTAQKTYKHQEHRALLYKDSADPRTRWILLPNPKAKGDLPELGECQDTMCKPPTAKADV